MNSEIGNRIRALREKRNLNQVEVGQDFDISDKAVSFWEVNGVRNKKLLKRIAEYFGVSLEYLKNGKEDSEQPITKAEEPKGEYMAKAALPKVVTVDSEGNENIAFIPVKARAGYLAGYGDAEYISELSVYRLPGFNNATYRMFEVAGRSMSPTVNEHDVVIGQWVENIADIRDERVYIVVSKTEGIVIKRLLNRQKEHGYIIGKSDNQNKAEYPHIRIPADDIKEIWYARAYMSNYFTAPSDLYNRVSNLEADVDALKLSVERYKNKK